jgi:hypothetical protein
LFYQRSIPEHRANSITVDDGDAAGSGRAKQPTKTKLGRAISWKSWQSNRRERERDGKGSSSGGTGQDRRWHGELGHICMRRWYMEMWLPLMGEKGTSTTGRRPQPAKQRNASFAASLHVCVVLVVCPVSARSSFTSRLGRAPPFPPLPSLSIMSHSSAAAGRTTQLNSQLQRDLTESDM